MNDRTRLISTIQNSIFAKLTLKDTDTHPIENTKLLTSVLKLLHSKYYQTNIDSFPPFILAIDNDSISSCTKTLRPELLEKFYTEDRFNESNFIEISSKNSASIENVKFGNFTVDTPDVLSDISEDNPKIKFFLVRKNTLELFYNGKFISHIQNICNENDSRGYNSRISIINTEDILARYKLYFKSKVDPIYWKNKSQRILSDKPERYLAQVFYFYLDNLIADGKVDTETLSGSQDNKLDIRVVHFFTNKVYIFEVKWIGKSEKTSYLNLKAEERANSGIEQLKIYLEEDFECETCVLILYDGRDLDDPITWVDEENWDKRIHKPPFRLFLESESASVRATRASKLNKN